MLEDAHYKRKDEAKTEQKCLPSLKSWGTNFRLLNLGSLVPFLLTTVKKKGLLGEPHIAEYYHNTEVLHKCS